MTDFHVRHFEHLVIKGLGIDHLPHLIPVYFDNYKRMVYLAQTASEKLQAMARTQAECLQLEYCYRFFGDEPLTLALKSELDS